MGANPMQKMKRNSILIGLIIGLVVGLIMCGGLYWFLTATEGSTGVGKDGAVQVAILNRNVKSGETINQADVALKTVSRDNAPTDRTMVVVNKIAKIDLSAGTILADNMLTTEDSKLTQDLREQEYNMIVLPTNLAKGNYIDIRLQLPNGADYIVVSKKYVQKANATTVWLNMNEEEILTMSNAIIEYYIMAGSKLYATTYTDPATQVAATPTYSPSYDVVELIKGDTNITTQITDGQGRFSERLKAIRNNIINKEVNKYNEESIKNIEKSIQEEIQALKESRETYFGALNAVN